MRVDVIEKRKDRPDVTTKLQMTIMMDQLTLSLCAVLLPLFQRGAPARLWRSLLKLQHGTLTPPSHDRLVQL